MNTSGGIRNQNMITTVMFILIIANWLNPPLKETGFVG
jgi:hypothetical protein